MTAPERRRRAILCLLAVGLLTVLAGGPPAAAVPSGALEAALPLTLDNLIRFDPELARERLAEAHERLRHRQHRRDVLVARLNALDAEIAHLRQRWRAASTALPQQRAALIELDHDLAPLLAAVAAAEAEAGRRHAEAGRALRDLALRGRGQQPDPSVEGRLRPLGALVLSAWRVSEAHAAALRRRRDEVAARRAEAAAELDAAHADAARMSARLVERARVRRATRAATRAARHEADVAAAAVERLLAELNRVATYDLVWAGVESEPVGRPPELAPPAAENIAVAHFGERRRGPQDRGVTIEPGFGQAVTAPAGGRVAFAGPFRGYGLLLIIDHGDGYHTLLSGMSRLKVGVNQWVRAGDPVATFENLDAMRPRLYVELRRNGRPVNPLFWLAAGDSKVSG